MTLVVENANIGPGTHVLVVGVGRYPSYPGFAPGVNTEGQIDSAEIGAQHVANWFAKKFYNPGRPLISLRILLSNEHGNQWRSAHSDVQVAAATTENFLDACAAWLADANKHPGSALILYFAGHGIGNLEQQSLFCEDYNRVPARKMEGAIDYMNLERTIANESKASYAWIFVDTCRTNSMQQTINGEFGRKVNTGSGPIAYIGGPRISSIFSTPPGGTAHGNAGAPSFFSEAMVKAFEGNAYCRRDGRQWACFTDVAFRAISKQLERIYIRERFDLAKHRPPRQQFDDTDAVIHCMPPAELPLMMVDISCDPDKDNLSHKLFWVQEGKEVIQQLPGQIWRTEIPPGPCAFGAIDQHGTRCRQLDRPIDLPFQQILVV
jgi:hypothetical protein